MKEASEEKTGRRGRKSQIERHVMAASKNGEAHRERRGKEDSKKGQEEAEASMATLGEKILVRPLL